LDDRRDRRLAERWLVIDHRPHQGVGRSLHRTTVQ
jgi:hypothetical protein